MTRSDTLKLFELLEQLYPKRSPARDMVTVAIWTEVFKPWTYAQVRDAVIRRARCSNFCPQPAELAVYLPAQEGDSAPACDAQRPDPRYVLWVKLYHEMKRRELARLGLPEFDGATGAEYIAWRAKCVAAGLDPAELLETARSVAYGGEAGRT